MNLALEARQFLRSTRNAILSTFSARFTGYPFGSVAPFVLDHNGHPVILISTLAEHTQNILSNPKVSLIAYAGNDDLQASARLTLIGEAIRIENEDVHLRTRYLRYFPQAAGYFDMHDFSFYRIEIVQARYIAGFGKMGWVSGNDISKNMLINEVSQLDTQETSIVEHMNADHVHSMIAYCKHFHNINCTHAQMLGIDCDGIDVSAIAGNETHILRFNFEEPIYDAQTARKALVAMSKAVQL